MFAQAAVRTDASSPSDKAVAGRGHGRPRQSVSVGPERDGMKSFEFEVKAGTASQQANQMYVSMGGRFPRAAPHANAHLHGFARHVEHLGCADLDVELSCRVSQLLRSTHGQS